MITDSRAYFILHACFSSAGQFCGIVINTSIPLLIPREIHFTFAFMVYTKHLLASWLLLKNYSNSNVRFEHSAYYISKMTLIVFGLFPVQIFASDSFLELTEYTREEILGRNCR